MEKVVLLQNEAETIALGCKIGSLIKPNSLITLNGDLGAGKTTFTKGLGKGLGITRVINSPTFTILKQYQGRLNLSHFDAYRLENQDTDLGFEEIFNSDDVCCVEWSDYIEDILPKERLEIFIKYLDDNSRELSIKAIGQKYEELIEEL